MKFSTLQKYILLKCWHKRNTKVNKVEIFEYYQKLEKKPKERDRQSTVTKSVSRLIKRGFLKGFGTRTPEKLYIKEIKITPKGKKVARKLLGEQQTLPLFKRRHK